ncbi:hypothetical protein JCM10207_000267 [Rhodosporidiobolus poonsookiae]
MVRFSLAALALSTAYIAPSAFAALAPLGQTVSDSRCYAYTDSGHPDRALCTVLYSAAGSLLFQGNTITTEVNGILVSLNEILALGGDEGNPLTDIVDGVTTGLVSNVLASVSNTLGAVGTTLQEIQPQCKCDLSNCLTRLQSAAQATAVPSDNAQDACNQARYACGYFYSSDQIEQVAPGCAEYRGTTSSDTEGSSQRMRVRKRSKAKKAQRKSWRDGKSRR